MRKTLQEKIQESQQEMEQLKKQQAKLQAQFNEQERKARTHRLCKRGGLVEKLLPELITLSDKQFDTFVEKTLLTEYVHRTIREITAEPTPPTDTSQAKANTDQPHPVPMQNGGNSAQPQAKTVGA